VPHGGIDMTTQSGSELEARREALKRWVPERPYKPLTQGINHTAVFALDLEATARFYTEVLGMPVMGVAPNRDEPGSTHITIDIGNGSAISFFDFPHVERLTKVAPEGGGNAMHIATPISRKNLAIVRERLDAAGAEYGEAGGSLYVPDPNGLTIELLPEDLVPEQRLDL